MRTTIDLPDALLEQIRPRLKAQRRTLREAVIEGLRRTLLEPEADRSFRLPDAAFGGQLGYAPGFDGDVAAALRQDAEIRLAAEGSAGGADVYQP